MLTKLPHAIRGRTREILEFALRNVEQYPDALAARLMRNFGISRQAASQHLQTLVEAGLLAASGQTRARTYRALPMIQHTKQLHVTPILEEDIAWREYIAPHLGEATENIREICHFGFTEILNNVLDHSGATRVTVGVSGTSTTIDITVTDNGTGIFQAIADSLELEDARHVALELSKGRLTTNAVRHAGGSLFVTAQLFDTLTIQSGRSVLEQRGTSGEATLRDEAFSIKGTSVRMSISRQAKRTLAVVLDEISDAERDARQARVHVPVSLMQYGEDTLMSRSQARRLVARLDDLDQVLLDFSGVASIGPAFADEVFRCFRQENPRVTLITANANQDVRKRIRAALAGAASTNL